MLAVWGMSHSRRDCPQQCSEVDIMGGRGLGPEKEVGVDTKKKVLLLSPPPSHFALRLSTGATAV
jgi:hypothetical protein